MKKTFKKYFWRAFLGVHCKEKQVELISAHREKIAGYQLQLYSYFSEEASQELPEMTNKQFSSI